MKRRCLGLLFATLALGLASLAHAQERSGPVGEWVGQVSWSEWPVVYSWAINADRTFSSGRDGRGHDGGGEWSARGARLTLKYEDGFRYEGELLGDAYSGTAYAADGRVFGSFSMSRASERPRDFDADEQD